MLNRLEPDDRNDDRPDFQLQKQLFFCKVMWRRRVAAKTIITRLSASVKERSVGG